MFSSKRPYTANAHHKIPIRVVPLQLLDILCGNAMDSTIVLLTGPILAHVILDATDAAIAAFEVCGATGALAKVIQQQAAAASKEQVPALRFGVWGKCG